jgi:Fe-S cluster assembly protein SufD
MAHTASVSSVDQLKEIIETRYDREPEWSLTRRIVAAENVFSLDWPHLERTPLKKRKLEDIPFWEANLDDAPPARLMVRDDDPNAVWLRFENNQLSHWEVGAALHQRGVIAAPLAESLTHPFVRAHLGELVVDRVDKVSALTASLWRSGVFLYLPDNLDTPVMLTVEYHANAGVRALFIRNLICAGKGTQVTVSERLTTDEGLEKVLLSEETEIFVGDDAEVDYGAIQLCSLAVNSFIRRHGQIGTHGKLVWHIGEFGSNLAVSEQVSHLAQPGARTESVTVFFGAKQQHQDYTAKSLHHAPHTQSNMVARGVMKGKARSIFTGVTHIESGAKGSDGRQREQTLMLSDEARADAIPSLIIDERDVYAAHAASAGPVDKSWIFYLMSRGLSESEAVRLIVHGFLAPVIDSISRPLLRDAVWDAVERKIQE